MKKRIVSTMSLGRSVIPLEFRRLLHIKSDGMVVFEFDYDTNKLSIEPYENQHIKCVVTKEDIDEAEAIPLDPDNNVFLSRKGLVQLFKKYLKN